MVFFQPECRSVKMKLPELCTKKTALREDGFYRERNPF